MDSPIIDGLFDVKFPLLINCTAQGSEPRKLEWRVNGTAVDLPTERGKIYPDGKLQIYKPTLEDEGLYQCVVSNEFGVDFSSKFNVKFRGECRDLFRVTGCRLGQCSQLSCFVDQAKNPTNLRSGKGPGNEPNTD